MTYRTKQRDEILRFFQDHADECYTAREVGRLVSAGEATVFRTLTALTESGLLKRFSSGRGGSATYQFTECASPGEHIHLKCENCGALLHLDCAFMEEISRHFREEHGFEMDSRQTVIYGLCGNCAGKKKPGGTGEGSAS